MSGQYGHSDDTNAWSKALGARLETAGIYLSQYYLNVVSRELGSMAAVRGMPLYWIRYKQFDILVNKIHSANWDRAFLFENSRFKARIFTEGQVLIDDCIVEFEDDIFLTATAFYSGTGHTSEEKSSFALLLIIRCRSLSTLVS